MGRIRVLIVDDSVVIRKILTNVLSEDPELEIVGVAANGKIALQKIPQVNPDLITLDIEMPILDGLETLKEIRKDYPRLPVIMFSTLTERGAEATLDALTLGASDYVTKPANVGKVSESAERLRMELVPKIKALVPKFETAVERPGPSAPVVRAKSGPLQPRPAGPQRVDIVAIGISTGGPNALAELLPALRKDFPVPVVIVQHMPPVFTLNLAKRLDAKSAVTVQEGVEGGKLEPGKVWIAPGSFHMKLRRVGAGVELTINEDPPENSCRPAVDVLFRSVAEIYGAHSLAVVMTGMGYDGHLGGEEIRERGGTVLAQDEESSVVWGMPGIVVTSGLSDGVFSLDDLPAAITRRVMRGRRDRMGVSKEEVSA